MTKVVINRCYGGFRLSDEAMVRYADLKGIKVYPEKERSFTIFWLDPVDSRTKNSKSLYGRDFSRDDPILVQVVEEMKKKASGHCARLEVIDIPKGTLYRIDEYDGMESIEIYNYTNWNVA